MSRHGFEVPPRRKVDIIEIATNVRRGLGPCVSDSGYVNLPVALEWLPVLLPNFEFEVINARQMGFDHGRTWPDRKLIHIREDVYDGMCQGLGRDRFTVAHELGHLFLHPGVALARAWNENLKIYKNSEWQADTFASALLIDEDHLAECRSVEEASRRFGVSLEAAQVRFSQRKSPKALPTLQGFMGR